MYDLLAASSGFSIPWSNILLAIATVAAATVTAIVARRASKDETWLKQRELDQTAFTAITTAQGKQIEILQKQSESLADQVASLNERVQHQDSIVDAAVKYIQQLRGILLSNGTSPLPPTPRELKQRVWRGRTWD
jgi:hypothetical protein